MPTTPATLHIGEVAEQVGLSLRTVRYYEEQGLVQPEGRTTGGFRLYSQAQVERLLSIKQMKPLGYSIEQMRELLDARDVLAGESASSDERTAARQTLAGFVTFTDERCAKLRRSIAAGEDLAAQLRTESGS